MKWTEEAGTHVFDFSPCEGDLPVVLPHLYGSVYKGWSGKRTRWFSVCPSRWARATWSHPAVVCLGIWTVLFFSCDQKPWGLMGIVSLCLVLYFWLDPVGGKTDSYIWSIIHIGYSLYVQFRSSFKFNSGVKLLINRTIECRRV